MSTHHTLIAKTTLALSDSDWNKVFNTAGELLNIGWDQLAPHEKNAVDTQTRTLFFWIDGDELTEWAEHIHALLSAIDSQVDVSYFFDTTGEEHGYWHNGKLRIEPHTPFYEVVCTEYTPLSNLVHTPDQKIFSTLLNDEVIVLTYDSAETVTCSSSDFTETHQGTLFQCRHDAGNSWVIEFNGQFYCEDIEHGQI